MLDSSKKIYSIFLWIFTSVSVLGNTIVLVGTIFYNTIQVDKINVMFIKLLACMNIVTNFIFTYISIAGDGAAHSSEEWDKLIADHKGVRISTAVFWCPLISEGTFIAFMILHRYYTLLRPLKSQLMRQKHVCITCIALILFSFVITFALSLCNENIITITCIREAYGIVLSIYIVCAVIIPLGTLSISLCGIFHIIRKRFKRNKTSPLHQSGPISTGPRRTSMIRKGTVILLWIGISFEVTILPLHIYFMIVESLKIKDSNLLEIWLYLMVLYVAGTAANPVIYTMLSRSFRLFLKSFVMCKCKSHIIE